VQGNALLSAALGMNNHKHADKVELAEPKGEVLVYQAEGGQFKVDVRLEDATVWLTQQ